MSPDSNPMIYAVCGGGTGGHIFPALAVAEVLRQKEPECVLLYFGRNEGMEKAIAEERGIEFLGLDVTGFTRKLALSNLSSLWKAARGFQRARQLLQERHVQCVFGTGGYITGPVMSAAVSLRIPTMIHESNTVPGLTNRLLANSVTRIAVSQCETRDYFPREKVVVTGFPLRSNLTSPTREQGCALFGLDPARQVVFIFPGSLAARRINRAVADMLPKVQRKLPDVQFLWMTGEADLGMAQRQSALVPLTICVRAFIREVPEAYAAADVVVARAGAGTVAEISATGKPALLIPYPYATANHQAYNAAILHRAGCADILDDKDVNARTLLEGIIKLLKRQRIMSECAAVWQANYPRHATEHLAQIIMDIARGKEGPKLDSACREE